MIQLCSFGVNVKVVLISTFLGQWVERCTTFPTHCLLHKRSPQACVYQMLLSWAVTPHKGPIPAWLLPKELNFDTEHCTGCETTSAPPSCLPHSSHFEAYVGSFQWSSTRWSSGALLQDLVLDWTFPKEASIAAQLSTGWGKANGGHHSPSPFQRV